MCYKTPPPHIVSSVFLSSYLSLLIQVMYSITPVFITYLYVVLQGKQTLITERKSIFNSSCGGCPGLLCLFIWVTLSLLWLSVLCDVPTWPVTGHTIGVWLHHAWSSMIHSGKYSLWGCIQRDSGRDSLKDLKSDLPDYITCWMSTW